MMRKMRIVALFHTLSLLIHLARTEVVVKHSGKVEEHKSLVQEEHELIVKVLFQSRKQ